MLRSLVIPLRDEEAVLPWMAERLQRFFAASEGDWEVVLVDDGSRDGTVARARDLEAFDPRFRLLRLAGPQGQQAALLAGLDHCRGEVAVHLDADLQEPPEEIPRLLEPLSAGFQVAYGVRTGGDGRSPADRLGSWALSVALPALTGLDVRLASFRALDREALDRLRRAPRRAPSLGLMLARIGVRQAGVPLPRHPRALGRSSYSWAAKVRTALRVLAMALGWGVPDPPYRLSSS